MANSARYALILSLLFAPAVMLSPSPVQAIEKITFTWRANPATEGVLGYRIYYGTSSRFSSDSLPKANFSYDYYIDVFYSERCTAGSPETPCEALYDTELLCDNLYGATPRCTIYNLPGQLYYFAMTAYNAQAESGYTQELNTRDRCALKHIMPLLLSNN